MRRDEYTDNGDGTTTRRRYVNDRLVEITRLPNAGYRGTPEFHRTVFDRLAHVNQVKHHKRSHE